MKDMIKVIVLKQGKYKKLNTLKKVQVKPYILGSVYFAVYGKILIG